jgi:hypothetical protein
MSNTINVMMDFFKAFFKEIAKIFGMIMLETLLICFILMHFPIREFNLDILMGAYLPTLTLVSIFGFSIYKNIKKLVNYLL